MIINIDHLTLSSDNFKKHTNFFKNLGYKINFIQTNQKNLKIKKQLVKNFNNFHDLSLLESDKNLNIELINENNINPQSGYIKPVFENVPKNLIAKKLKAENLKNLKLEEVFIKDFNFPVFNLNSSTGFSLRKVFVETSNLKASLFFWKLLGFRLELLNKHSYILQFRSITRKLIFNLILRKVNEKKQTFLDDLGFTSVAFITSSIENEIQLFKKENFKTTKIEETTIARKKLKISFVTGPVGEIVELISFK